MKGPGFLDLLEGACPGAVVGSNLEALDPWIEIAPERVAEDTRAGLAPKPGRDFTPLVEDQARIKAIMKLVSDIYNGVHLPYSQDGSTFKNKEGKLPAQPSGF